MKRAQLAILLISLLAQGLGAQQGSKQLRELLPPESLQQQPLVPLQAELAVADRLQLAVSSKNYPVTPGDVYRITFVDEAGHESPPAVVTN